jgi:type II secretory pathway predicted ATPase ExeA
MPDQPKFFNTDGPCVPADHYMLPALPRLSEIQDYIAKKKYIIINSPRQSGKTTLIRAAAGNLNEAGSYHALYCDLQKLRDITDKKEAMTAIVGNLYDALDASNVEALKKAMDDLIRADLGSKPSFEAAPLEIWLRTLCSMLEKELVVFFDEADTLTDRVLLSFLSQLRAGYIARSTNPFPRTIALVSMRSIRDYRAKIRPETETMGSSSPFNIATRLRLQDFTLAEVKELYGQHTKATGQVFEEEAIQRAWYWSEGQPWLVNALAFEAVDKILSNNYETVITASHMDEAAGNLIKGRSIHIDSLLARLDEPRMQRIIEPILAITSKSSVGPHFFKTVVPQDYDLNYFLYLGIVKKNGHLRPSNPIYASAIARYLSNSCLAAMPEIEIKKFIDGQNIYLTPLLKEFQHLWNELGRKFLDGIAYHEAAAQVLLYAFLRPLEKVGALISHKYALRQSFADIAIKYAEKNYVIELNIRGNKDSRQASQEQLLGYMDDMKAKEGWLIFFDKKSDRSWSLKKKLEDIAISENRIIHVLGF